jgi:hypothetical protein
MKETPRKCLSKVPQAKHYTKICVDLDENDDKNLKYLEVKLNEITSEFEKQKALMEEQKERIRDLKREREETKSRCAQEVKEIEEKYTAELIDQKFCFILRLLNYLFSLIDLFLIVKSKKPRDALKWYLLNIKKRFQLCKLKLTLR